MIWKSDTEMASSVCMGGSRRATRDSGFGITLLASFVVIVATEGLTARTHSLPAAAPLALNILAFAAFSLIVIALTNRTLFSIALVTAVYELLVFCNRLKIDYLS